MSTTWPCAPWRRRDGFDFLAFHFFLDHGERTLAVLIGVALRLKVRRRHFLDQAHAKLQLLAWKFNFFPFCDRVEVADLVFEKQEVKNQAARGRRARKISSAESR